MPASGTYRSAARAIVTCAALGAIPALVAFIFGHGVTAGDLVLTALQGFVFSSCIAIPCWAVIPRISCKLEKQPRWLSLTAILAALGFFAVSGCLVADGLLAVLHLIRPDQMATTFFWSVRICLAITFAFGLISMGIATLQSQLAETRDALHAREIAEERARKLAAEARFASLESRVHPHFLFNTLNSISALVRENPAEAEHMIERLSALLRYSLDSETAGVVRLSDELNIVASYLEIEKVRFGDRLRYSIDADSAAQSHLVPALSIQTLVENSVKYAVGVSREGAEILVNARIVDGALRVEVTDDGPGFEPHTSVRPGHGLDLLRQRLASLFGAAASLEMSGDAGRTLVAMRVGV